MVDSTISGRPGIIMKAVKTPTRAWPTPMRISVLGKPSNSEGPTKTNAIPVKKPDIMMVKRLSHFRGTYYTAMLEGM